MSKEKEFIHMSRINYHDVPYSNESETEINLSHKNKWLRLGISTLKEIAKEVNVDIDTYKNPSGSIDRGYVSAFFYRDNKYVYVSIGDATKDILYRTASNLKDYSGGSNNYALINNAGFKELRVFIINNLF